ncbi:type II toxin-antitoxin system RatA family toxin [Teredinibacter franksiae]|jgi:Oligoketide cyclase/lipid transport protein|uniref:type II toxin-antitoxin system RatA family toxin n=1 Tax=Teredinibacter franksiae TaxID=2761453 RepID=UPI0016235F41|nr:type II toxin-antitoxin system RatA family toxin [Teredinibacter franksiae]
MANRIERSALVMFSAEQMFDLVSDFESYPQFLNGCVGAELLAKEDTWLEARLHLQKAGIRQSFVTHNTWDKPQRMHLRLVEGPFKSMEGEWHFQPLSAGACKVSFWIEFEFSNKLVALAVGKLFEHVASDQVNALCSRAKQVYSST